MTQPVPYSSERTCSVCGKFGAFEFDGEALCGDCTQSRGSCCAEREVGPVCDQSHPGHFPANSPGPKTTS